MTRKSLFTILAALTLLCIACGKRGDPKPPVPVIPQTTNDLAVTQRADRAILSWSYPALTTAGRSLTDVRRITIYRYVEELPVSAVTGEPASATPAEPGVPLPVALFAKLPTLPAAQFEKLATRIDAIEKTNLASATAGARLLFTDAPPLRAKDGRPVRVTYGIVTESSSARSALSNLTSLVPLAVAMPPAGFTASAKPEGVALVWEAPKTAVGGAGTPIVIGYNVYRTAAGETLDELANPVNTAPVKTTTYTDVPAYGEHEYRVTAVAMTGPPLVQSEPSASARATFRDLVPPPMPANLSALTETKLVRLIWDPVDAPDLAGYRVYRTEGTGDPIKALGTIPLTNQVLTTTTYVDNGVNLGISYRYGVATVDKSGNESEKTWTDWVLVPKTP